MGDGVELDRRGEVAAERLLDDHARVLREARGAEALDHGLEQRRRNREVVRRPLRRAERRLQRREGRGILVVAADVAAAARAACRTPPDRRCRLRARRCRARAACISSVLRLVEATPITGTVERSLLHHRVERRKDLLVREVAGEAEDDERVGMGGAGAARSTRGGGRSLARSAGFSTWPPNSWRIAESTWSAKSASPRELKRSKSAALSTCAGTAFVDRRLDRPAAFAGIGDAAAVGGELRVLRAARPR